MAFNRSKASVVIREEYNDIPDHMGYCPDCPICGETLRYSYSKSEFKCFNCDSTFDDDEFDNEDALEIPWGCKTCGGPYPSCTSSCKLFDE